MLIPLLHVILKNSEEKRDRKRKLEKIQRRLEELEKRREK